MIQIGGLGRAGLTLGLDHEQQVIDVHLATLVDVGRAACRTTGIDIFAGT